MEKKGELRPPWPAQKRVLGPVTAVQTGKINDFLRHARAALQRPQQSGTSNPSYGRAKRLLVTQTDSINDALRNPSAISEIACRQLGRGSQPDSEVLVSEKPKEHLVSRTGQTNLALMMQEDKIDYRMRYEDLEEMSDDNLKSSTGNVKNLISEDGNMGSVHSELEGHDMLEQVPCSHKRVEEHGNLINRYSDLDKDYTSSSCGEVGREVCMLSSQREQPFKSRLSDDPEKVLSLSNNMVREQTHLAKGCVENGQCIGPHACSCEKQHIMLSNKSLMHMTEDRHEPVDAIASTCHSSSQNRTSSVYAGGGEKLTTDTERRSLSSYFSSLAFTENGCSANHQVKRSSDENQRLEECKDLHAIKIVGGDASEDIYMGGTGSLAKRDTGIMGDQKFDTFIGKETINQLPASSAVSAASSLHCTPAAPLYSTTCNLSIYNNINSKIVCHPGGGPHIGIKNTQKHMATHNHHQSNLLLNPTLQNSSASLAPEEATSIQVSSSAPQTFSGLQNQGIQNREKHSESEISQIAYDHVGQYPKPKQDLVDREVSVPGNVVRGDDIWSHPPEPRSYSSNTNLHLSSIDNSGKVVVGKEALHLRRRNPDSDAFFKVNGKLYQKLGKIGSGGSSEVYKVISSDCTIFALKKIKLRGRDYATAYGFCQEIKYLNRLRGKNNIIQLIDYEVTDRRLLEEANDETTNMKDGRIKNDVYIYMVLEYGEIDLAHMLSQKWKEMDGSHMQLDENWLRFYWQQILKAVNTIHEERIVHSDLKPANFLLVKGSLKLIDFGIAKAIQSDTTNIQRDSQVGTLNYMSPEAFMCNDQDADGNTIKCGRPSDIWSLGCILYQMVYGRTPFAEYKSFWAKYKVITDREHKITYAPMSNPLLADLMKKCLAWERNERWRIPQLLEHPFLAPLVPLNFPSPLDQQCKLLTLIAQQYSAAPQVPALCRQLKQLILGLSKDVV